MQHINIDPIKTDAIVSAIKSCGNSLLLVKDAERTVSLKEGKANFVTKYDLAVQNHLKEEFKKIMPEAAFYGEEGDDKDAVTNGYAFIVDPIDGTMNFIKNYRHSCVSVALAYQGEIIFGAVFNPYANELFVAEKGKGAYLNAFPIHVSDYPLEDGLVCFGTSPYYPDMVDETFELAKGLHRASADIRRSGSAALDLCYVASGRCDLFFELHLSPWDYAAGSLIVTEAGGKVTRMDKTPLIFEEGCSVLAGNPACYDAYFEVPAHIEIG